jgi:hypothetical protein
MCTSIASIISSAIVSCSVATAGSFSAATRSRLARVRSLRMRDAVVVEHRVHPLLPLGALMHEHVPAPHPRTEVEHVRRRDP